ncbi:MAG: hypothetical protein WCF57_02465 [Pyrinomonadaceae bacterium]
MDDKQRRRKERLDRCGDFGATLAVPFPATSKGGTALAGILACVAELASKDASLVSNISSARQGTSIRQDTRAALRAQVNQISTTGDAIGLDHPEVKGKFPRLKSSANDQMLLSVARSFATDAEPIKALFIEYDMPADFIERLNAGVNAFEQSIDQQNAGAGASRSSRVAIEEILDRGEQELERFDTAVRNKYDGDAATLAAWESANRLERGPRKSKEAGAPPQQE